MAKAKMNKGTNFTASEMAERRIRSLSDVSVERMLTEMGRTDREIDPMLSCSARAQEEREKNAPIDTSGAERAFGVSFINHEMCPNGEFYPLFADFIKRKRNRFVDFYENIPKMDSTEFISLNTDDTLRQEMVSLLYGGVKAGDVYCKEVMRVLYRTYYKSEYNQLKRFSVLTEKDLLAQGLTESKDSLDLIKVGRLLCMANVLGIEIDEHCRTEYIRINDVLAEEREKQRKQKEELEDSIGCNEEIREDLRDPERVKRIYDPNNPEKVKAFTKRVANSCSIVNRALADYSVGNFSGNYIGELIEVNTQFTVKYSIAILSLLGLTEDEFADENIATMIPYMAVLRHFASLVSDYKRLQSLMLYPERMIASSNSHLLSAVRNLNFVDDAPAKTFVHKEEKKKGKEYESVDESREDLEEELATLRKRLREKEGEYAELRTQYDNERTARKDLEEQLNETESEKLELQKLRNYVYSETEEETPPQNVSFEEMKLAIRDRSVLIIGGNENWTKKLKNMFPRWKYVKANVSPTVTNKIVKTCEKVYFFTDTLGHSNYAKYIELARIHNVDFSYMHGVNLKMNVRQVYKDLIEAAEVE